jgi:hypothetical protein
MIAVHIAAFGAVLSAAPMQTQQPPAAESPSAPSAAAAVRTAQAPSIDGLDDDAVWARAPAVDAFRQFQPQPDAAPTLRTSFRVAYDDRNLYVFVRAFDPRPDSIMRALTRRDVRGPSDQIKVIVDSYNDRRTGYEFAVNPDGVKRDFAVFNDGQEDGSWNGVWDVGTRIDSLGWTAEFEIPLSQLRYADADRHTFGFGVWRDIERYAERVSWPLYSVTRTGLVSQIGRLDGLADIPTSTRVELTPYTVAKNVSRQQTAGGFERAQQITAGADLKLGITPNITLDATVNPDFGQVEADPAVLNLTALETFVSERRPFFVEGTGFYQFGLNCYIVVDCSTNEGLFYSRRVGRAPTLLDDYGDARTPTATPIAAATKLTGRTPGGLTFGVLDAVTRHVDGSDDRTVEPRSNYAVVRAQQDLRGGEAGVSVIATAVNRALDDWTRPYMHDAAYVGGASFRNRFAGGRYEVAGSITGSHVTGSPEALRRTQRSGVHYYQQPGDDLVLDTMRTSLSGHAEQIKFGKYGGGVTRFETSFVHQSAGFEVNDLGFLRRADVIDWSTWAALNFMTPKWFYNWIRFNANHWQHWNTSGRRLESAVNANAHLGLRSNWNLHAGVTFGGLGESYCDRCTRGGPPLRRSRGIHPWFGVNGDSRHALVPSLWVNLSTSDEGRSKSVSLNPSLSLRFSTRLQTEIGANYGTSTAHTQWFGNFTDEGTEGTDRTHHSFAHLEQRTLSVSLRATYTATPDLTVELYGAPFMSTGTYSDFREISATPDAAAYDDRFVPFTPPEGEDTTFKFHQLRTNTVLRWEYLPGSTLFLVWAHGRESFTDDPTRPPWAREARELLDLHPDNTFLIKVAYWLNR